MNKKDVPKYTDFMNPTIRALHALGGSGTISEISAKVTEFERFPADILAIPHKTKSNDKSYNTEIEYRLAWARTYLKSYGLLENSTRGVWALTEQGRQIHEINPSEVVAYRRSLVNTPADESENEDIPANETIDAVYLNWREILLDTLLSMSPDGFERLAQRLLREAGFIQVEVLGRSGDGGLDGKGILQVAGLISFHVYFQCKRYQGSVSSGQVRDFRGAMQGRADKGIIITTGSFTKDALKEAARDGATPIDLVNGERLLDMLKELKLGVKTEMVEQVTIDPSWFQTL